MKYLTDDGKEFKNIEEAKKHETRLKQEKERREELIKRKKERAKEVENAYNYNMKLESKISIAHLVKEERMRRQIELNKANQERAFERTQKGVQGFIK